jgi:hypothetical protein
MIHRMRRHLRDAILVRRWRSLPGSCWCRRWSRHRSFRPSCSRFSWRQSAPYPGFRSAAHNQPSPSRVTSDREAAAFSLPVLVTETTNGRPRNGHVRGTAGLLGSVPRSGHGGIKSILIPFLKETPGSAPGVSDPFAK